MTQDLGLTKVTLTLLSTSRLALSDRVKRGELNPMKLGKKPLFTATDLAAFLATLCKPKAVPCGEPELRV